MMGKTEGKRRKVQQKIRWLDSIIDSMNMNLSKLGDSKGQGSLVGYSLWGHRVRQYFATENKNSAELNSEF